MSDEVLYALFAVGALVLIAFLVLAIVLAVRVWKTGKYLQTMGVGGKWVFWGAIIYTVFPFDLLPDPIYIDDVGVLGGALIYLSRLAAKTRKNRQQQAQAAPPPPQLRRHPPQRTR
ncbi:YkvA family protein [Dactylosporangium sp. NPDC051484]|uniref:YkvA family protein n=1 Tax=Dactylosporangium sp. NPDC051484 TaxID=3154942 RepID=UPI00344CAE1B